MKTVKLMSLASAVLLLAGFHVASEAESFARHPKVFKVGPNPSEIVAVDLNGDSLPEILTADIGKMKSMREENPAHEGLSFLVPKAELEYERMPPLESGFAPYSIVIANIDELKALDIVVGNFHVTRERNITVFRNLGEDNFEPLHFSIGRKTLRYTKMLDADEKPVFSVPGITAVDVADLNGDDYRDVIAAGWSSNVLLLFPGTADTYLGLPKVISAPGGPRDVKAADFDGDGKIDLASVLYSVDEIALWKGNGYGSFEEVARFTSRGKLPHKLQVKDMNQDGKADLIVSHCHADDSIVIFYGDGNFGFALSQEVLLGKDRLMLEHEIRDIVVADLNGDTKLDIVAACFKSSQVTVLLNTTKENATPLSFKKETYSFDKGKPRAVCVADFNQDNKNDIGVALWDADAVALLLAK